MKQLRMSLRKVVVLLVSQIQAIFPATIAAASVVPDAGARNEIIYEIFVRSFCDSNHDGIGDLNGITDHLDYLNSGSRALEDPNTLGVDAIWLTPIFASPSYHGYDATDFKKINPVYGNDQDFARLVREAHRRGIKVFLDLAVNHASTSGEWFREGTENPRSPLRDYFVWRNEDPRWGGFGRWWPFRSEFYFSSFSQHMADLNWENPAVVRQIHEVFHFWSRKGVDGYRLDAARYYVEGPNGESDTRRTHEVLRTLVHDIKGRFPDSLFLGEIWADAGTISTYLNTGDQLDSAFNFPAASGLLRSLKNGHGKDFIDALQDSMQKVVSPWRLAPFSTNHDMVRIATEVDQDLAKLKLAATVILTLPGQPTIYYGEEIGLANSLSGRSPGDLGKRTPMQWDDGANHGFTDSPEGPWQPFSTESLRQNVANQINRAPSLLHYYQRLIRLRKETPGLVWGGIRILNSPDSRLGIYLRTAPPSAGANDFELVVLNFSDDTIGRVEVEFDGGSFPAGTWEGKALWGQAAARFSQASRRSAVMQIENIAQLNASIIHFSKP
jgi:glycosidase